jgi:hypothetical protein
MSLDKSNLQSGLLGVFASFPVTRDLAAQQLASAYDTYAKQGQSCAAATPTLVKLTDLENGLKDALNAGGSYGDVAQAFADAYEDYWTGALFGPTGTVTTIGGTASLKSGLEALWQAQAATLATFADSAQYHADLLDTFTKTVQVTDSAVPCGPSPIS